MPRHPRVHAEGLLYHVMARGNDEQKIFLGEGDCRAFIEALRTVRHRYPFSLYAYALMPSTYCWRFIVFQQRVSCNRF